MYRGISFERAINVMATELSLLKDGTYYPETAGFELIKIAIRKIPGGIEVITPTGKKVVKSDDWICIDRYGNAFVSFGPSYYNDPIRKAISRSVFSQKILEYSDEAVTADAKLGETCRVLSSQDGWKKSQSVLANSGKLVVVFQEREPGMPVFYEKFVVRNCAKGDSVVLEAISKICEKFPKVSSGAFERALKEQWEPFALDAAESYYSAAEKVAA